MPAVSQAQQEKMGAELERRKEGKKPMIPSMNTGQVREFASTPRTGLPARAAHRDAAKKLAAARVSRRQNGPAAARGVAARRSAKAAVRSAVAVALALFGLALALPAQAVTWYVNAGPAIPALSWGAGSDAGSDTSVAGRSATHPFYSIGAVNSRMNAGEKCYVIGGPYGYGDYPNPAAAGVDGDATHLFRFIGLSSAGLSTASGPVLNTLDLPITKRWMTLRNFQFGFGATFADTARWDSLITVKLSASSTGDLNIQAADYIILDGITGINTFKAGNASSSHCSGLKVYNSTIASSVYLGTPSANTTPMGYCDSLLFCRVGTTSGSALSNVEAYGLRNSTIRDCNFLSYGYNRSFIVQDSCFTNHFANDTLTYMGFSFKKGYRYGTIHHTIIDSCLIKPARNNVGIDFRCAAKQLTLTNTVVAVDGSQGTALQAVRWRGRNFIDHNTFFGNTQNEVVAMYPVYGTKDSTFVDTTLITNNIIDNNYKAVYPCHYNCSSMNCVYPPGTCISYQPATIDSAYYGGGSHLRHVWVDGNLYANWNKVDCMPTSTCDTLSNAPGAFCVGMYMESCTGRFDQFAGGNGCTTNWNTYWCPACDDSSKFGSALFVGDTSSAATFTADLRLGSAAIAAALDGTDIGARAYGCPSIAYVSTRPIIFYRQQGNLGTDQTATISLYNNGATGCSSATFLTFGYFSEGLPGGDIGTTTSSDYRGPGHGTPSLAGGGALGLTAVAQDVSSGVAAAASTAITLTYTATTSPADASDECSFHIIITTSDKARARFSIPVSIIDLYRPSGGGGKPTQIPD